MLILKPTFLLGFLTYSMYLFGTIGADVSGLSFIPIVVLLLLFVFYSNKCIVPKTLIVFSCIFFISYFLSYLLNFKTDYSNYKFIMFCAKFWPLILIPCFIREGYRNYFNGIFTALVLFVALAFINSINQIQNFNVNDRLEIGVYNPIWIGRAAFECVLISILLLKTKKIHNILLLLMVSIVAYATGSKGPVIAFISVLSLKYLTSVKLNMSGLRKILTSVFVVLIAFGSIVKVSSDTNSYVVQRFLLAVPNGSTDAIIEESRTVVWPISIIKFLNEDSDKIIFGQGVGNFSKLYLGQYSDARMYPHNILLELIIEQGLLLFTISIFSLLYALRKADNSFVYLFIYHFINSMFSGDLILNEFIFFYISWSIIAKTITKLEKNEDLLECI